MLIGFLAIIKWNKSFTQKETLGMDMQNTQYIQNVFLKTEYLSPFLLLKVKTLWNSPCMLAKIFAYNEKDARFLKKLFLASVPN